MLGSNQRPLPCEVGSIMSWLFAEIHLIYTSELQVQSFGAY
jgi:hypothetical protein